MPDRTSKCSSCQSNGMSVTLRRLGSSPAVPAEHPATAKVFSALPHRYAKEHAPCPAILPLHVAGRFRVKSHSGTSQQSSWIAVVVIFLVRQSQN